MSKPGHLSPTRVIVASFCAVILFGTVMLMLPIATRDGQLALIDALFTATSATCVTGLIVYDTFSKFTLFGQAVILLLIQIGGLGLVTLTTFFNLALRKKIGFKSMKLASESISLDEAAGAKKLIYVVMRTSLGFELIGAILLMGALVPRFGARGAWMSVFTAISAFCNAGFDLFGSLGPYSSLVPFAGSWYVLIIIMLLIVCGGLGFIVWQDLFNFHRRKKLTLHSKLVLIITACLIVGGAFAIGAMEWENPGTMGGMTTPQKILSSLFQSVTCRTAGFNSIDQAGMHSISKLTCTVLMFIGAAPGGTGGGIKITTFAIVILAVAAVLRGREDPVLRERRIDKKTVYRALTITTLGLGVVICTTLVMVFNTPSRGGMIDGNLVDCLYEAASAFGTVGLSVGVTGQLSALGKAATALTMLIGRVGPISMGMTLAARADELSRREVLPEAKIVVG
ncbi:potassium transporter Trk [Anaerofilum sp. BX8]|uniref:Potassium transporter Trk n=2 Tax=Anaerofilum hominis TaxID=2763016 RepID=A0A923I6G9_9FIRM|nr:potassium transporter Trk [Anaerofilum hominis]